MPERKDYQTFGAYLKAVANEFPPVELECLNCGHRYDDRATEDWRTCPKCGRSIV